MTQPISNESRAAFIHHEHPPARHIQFRLSTLLAITTGIGLVMSFPAALGVSPVDLAIGTGVIGSGVGITALSIEGWVRLNRRR